MRMVKTDMRCATKDCGWTHTAHIPEDVTPTMYMCGNGHLGVEVVKRYHLDKSNYNIEV